MPTSMSSSKKYGNIARKPHIAIISYYFPPMGGGGVQRITKFLKYSHADVFQISVITVKPSAFYAYDESLVGEIPAAVNVVRTDSLDPFRLSYLLSRRAAKQPASEPAKHESSGKLRKWSNLLFFPDSRAFWRPFAVKALQKLHAQNPIDLVVATMPPFTCGLIANSFFRKSGVPYVLDYRDGWISNPYLPELPKILANRHRRAESALLNNAAGVVFVNPSLRQVYSDAFPALSAKQTCVIRNGFDPADFNWLASATGRNPKFTLGFMGTIYSQGNVPETLLDALAMLKKREADLAHRLQIVFLGKWTPEFEVLVAQKGLDELVKFMHYRPHREALAIAKDFDALALAVDSRQSGSRALTPGRIYEYLALKKPILAMCPPESEVAEIVQLTHAGEAVEYHNRERIAATLQKWLKNRDALPNIFTFRNIEQFNRKVQSEAFWQFIGEICR
jgi:glycosyltransferase involved in cell wall biosynthesis